MQNRQNINSINSTDENDPLGKTILGGTMVFDKFGKDLTAPYHPNENNMGDIILYAQGKSPHDTMIYCVYEKYPHQLYTYPYDVKNSAIYNNVINNKGFYFPKGIEVFANVSDKALNVLNGYLQQLCDKQLTRRAQQKPAQQQADFIYKSEKTGTIFKGTLKSNRLAVLEPVSAEESLEYNKTLHGKKFVCLNQSNKTLFDNLFKNKYYRDKIEGKEYIFNVQLFSEATKNNNGIKDAVNYELSLCNTLGQKIFK